MTDTITAAEYQALIAKQPARGNKYHARKVQGIDGQTFDSQAEARRYAELVTLQDAGFITRLRVHPVYRLEVNGVLICRYEGDFAYFESDREVVEDVKGVRTRVYVMKRKLMKAIHGIEIREVEA